MKPLPYNPAIQFPMRPVDGGPLPKSPKKLFHCSYEAKINGRRVMLQPETKQAWNRHGQKSDASLTREQWESLQSAARDMGESFGFDPKELWFDAEAIHNRLPEGQGSIILIDVLTDEGYELRRQMLEHRYPILNESVRLVEDEIYLAQSFTATESIDAWSKLQERNKQLGYELFEGFVAKRCDSLYIPIKSADSKSSSWIKHRWWNKKA